LPLQEYRYWIGSGEPSSAEEKLLVKKLSFREIRDTIVLLINVGFGVYLN
jgi:hypothetical protein